jgi:hypothetical protein
MSQKQHKALESERNRIVERLQHLRTKCGNKNTASILELVEQLEKVNIQRKKLQAHSLPDMPQLPELPEYADIIRTVNLFISVLESMVDQISPDTVRVVSSFITALFNVFQNPTWASIITNLTNFLVQHLPEKAAYFIRELFTTLFGKLTAHGADDNWNVMSILDKLDTLCNLEIYKDVEAFVVKSQTVILSAVSLTRWDAIDFTVLLEKFQSFKSVLPDIKDVYDLALRAYQFCVENWVAIVSGDWSVLPLYKDETQSFETEVRLIESAFNYAIKGAEVALRDQYKLTLRSFEKRLDAAVGNSKKLAARCTSVQQKLAIGNYVRRLYELQAAWYATKKDTPSKSQPYAVKLSGPSSCGKSLMTETISKTILSAYGYDPSEEGLTITSNINEKFESNIMPSHKLIVCDDVANSKTIKPNYDRILNYVNTVPRPLEKAAVEDKGKYFPENVALLVTTNVEDLDVTRQSNCGASILRRFALHIHVRVREEFRNDYGGVKDLEEVRYDIYELTLSRFKNLEDDGVVEWDVIPRLEWVGDEETIDRDFEKMLQFIRKDCEQHKKKQEKKFNMLQQNLKAGMCHDCGIPSGICRCCDDTKLEAHVGGIFDRLSTEHLIQLRSLFVFDLPHASFTGMGSEIILNTRGVVANLWFKKLLWDHRGQIFLAPLLILVTSILLTLCELSPFLLTLLPCLIAYVAFSVLRLRRIVDRKIQSRCDQLSSVTRTLYESVQENSLKLFGFGFSIFVLYKAIQAVRQYSRPKAQDMSSFLDSSHKAFRKEEENRLTQIAKNDARDYKEGFSRHTPIISQKSSTTTSKDLQMHLQRTLRVVTISQDGKKIQSVNGVFVSGNVIMVPDHAIPDGTFSIETTSDPSEPCARTKDQKVTGNMVIRRPESDFALVHLPSAPSSSSLVDFFPETQPQFYGRSTVLVHKTHQGRTVLSRQAIRPSPEVIKYESDPATWFRSAKYYSLKQSFKGDLEFNSFPGLCGSPYVDAEKGIIYGFHVAGFNTGSTVGYANCLTRPLIMGALHELESQSNFLMTHSLGELKVDTYNTPFTLVEESPLYMRDDGLKEKAVITYLGTVLKDGQHLTSNARTPYVKTPFKGVKEEFGPSLHRPPTHVNSTEKTMKTFNKLCDPVQHYEMDTLNKAIDDYADHTTTLLKDDDKSFMRIFTMEEALDGTNDGIMAGLPSDTSAGFPLNKAKKSFLMRDPFDESLIQVPRSFNEDCDVPSEVHRILECWRRGQRSEAIFKASSKVNELLPNEKAKDKVRKFYGSPFAFSIASRMALGGVPEFMRRYQIETECLVGINATSAEWSSFHKYLTKYGTNNMIAGDFSGFDTRMAAQITTAAASIIVRWYKAAGMSDADLTLVKGALSDICHPNMLIDGDLYRLANANPSGNLITVQLNSICNSLMMRYCYYAINPRISVPFARNVALGTYGDDNAMSVSRSAPWYNHTACQKAFKAVGIDYTMADKGSESVPYITIDGISFLKRNFVRHETLGVIVAPIDKDSIYKKFYYVKKPNETPLSFPEQFGAFCDGSFREAYLHGRDFYEGFSQSIRNIVRLNDELKGVVSFIPYDEMTIVLKPYYDKNYKNVTPKLFAESDECEL